MSGGFEVEPEEVLAVARVLRDQGTALDASGGGLPDADGGVMTGVIENAGVGIFASNEVDDWYEDREFGEMLRNGGLDEEYAPRDIDPSPRGD